MSFSIISVKVVAALQHGDLSFESFKVWGETQHSSIEIHQQMDAEAKADKYKESEQNQPLAWCVL